MELLPRHSEARQAEIDRDWRACGYAAAMLSLTAQRLKVASVPETVHALQGKLYLSQSGWLLLAVPNALGRGAFDALCAVGAELPTRDTGDPEAVYNAHISVMTKDEVDSLGGGSKINERGHMFAYTLGPVKELTPSGWGDVSKCWIIEIQSPELKALRKSYGLTALPRGDHEFHITIGIRRKRVLHGNDISKFHITHAKAATASQIYREAFELLPVPVRRHPVDQLLG